MHFQKKLAIMLLFSTGVTFYVILSKVPTADFTEIVIFDKRDMLQTVYHVANYTATNILSVVQSNLKDSIFNPRSANVFNTLQENMTLITAYFDLGKLPKGRRPDKNRYKYWADAYRFVNNPLVFYTDSDDFFVHMHQVRNYLPEKTKIMKIEKHALWPFKKIDKIKAIFSIPDYPKHQPNTVNPEYSATQHAKYAFVEDAIINGYFPNKFYAWIDIGYFRNAVDINRYYQLFAPQNIDINKIAINQVGRYYNANTPYNIFRNNSVWVAGGMFIGTPSLLLKFTTLYRRAFDFYLDQQLMNTDQQMLYAIYSKEGRKSIKPEIELQPYPAKKHFGDEWFYLGYHCRHLLPVELCPSGVPVCPIPKSQKSHKLPAKTLSATLKRNASSVKSPLTNKTSSVSKPSLLENISSSVKAPLSKTVLSTSKPPLRKIITSKSKPSNPKILSMSSTSKPSSSEKPSSISKPALSRVSSIVKPALSNVSSIVKPALSKSLSSVSKPPLPKKVSSSSNMTKTTFSKSISTSKPPLRKTVSSSSKPSLPKRLSSTSKPPIVKKTLSKTNLTKATYSKTALPTSKPPLQKTVSSSSKQLIPKTSPHISKPTLAKKATSTTNKFKTTTAQPMSKPVSRKILSSTTKTLLTKNLSPTSKNFSLENNMVYD